MRKNDYEELDLVKIKKEVLSDMEKYPEHVTLGDIKYWLMEHLNEIAGENTYAIKHMIERDYGHDRRQKLCYCANNWVKYVVVEDKFPLKSSLVYDHKRVVFPAPTTDNLLDNSVNYVLDDFIIAIRYGDQSPLYRVSNSRYRDLDIDGLRKLVEEDMSRFYNPCSLGDIRMWWHKNKNTKRTKGALSYEIKHMIEEDMYVKDSPLGLQKYCANNWVKYVLIESGFVPKSGSVKPTERNLMDNNVCYYVGHRKQP